MQDVKITYAEGDSQSSVTKDITLYQSDKEGVTVTWVVTEGDAITIEGYKGVVTRGEEDGKVKLTVTLLYKEKSLSKPFSLKVLASAPEVVVANEIKIEGTAELEVGDEAVFTATVLPADAADKAYAWSSSNESVATVSESGIVAATGEGEAKIIAKLVSNPAVFAEFPITVSKKVELSAISQVLEAEVGTVVKIRAGVVAANAQGYLLYDDSAYIQYFLGAGATLEFTVGDQVEVIGPVGEYNGTKQLTKEATATKLGSGYSYLFEGQTYDASGLAEYVNNVKLGDNLYFDVTVTSVNDNYVNATINGAEGYGVAIAYPTDSSSFEVGKVYRVYGYALYAKVYNEVNYVYLMASKAGQVYTITFDTTYDATIEPIKFIDFNDVELPDLFREEYIFAGWKEGNNYVDAITENRDYALTAELIARDIEAVEFELNGGELVFDNQFFIGNYNNCGGINKKYDCFTIYKKGSSSVAWASQYYLKFFMKEVEAGSNVYKIVYKAGESVPVTGDLLSGVTVDYDYIISSNASNSEGHPYFQSIYNEENITDNYFYFVVPENCEAKCNIKVIFALERFAVDPVNTKAEVGVALYDCTKDYYDFAGWYDNAEFNGEAVKLHTKGITKYYARWTPTEYGVTFHLNEGTTAATLPEKYTIESEDIALPTASEMVKEGFSFLGWFDNEAGTGDAYTKIATGSHGDLDLYAIWQSNVAEEKELSDAEVAIFNANNITKYVFADASVCNYLFKGVGLDAKYEAEVSNSCIYTTLADAINHAVEGDVIYVFAGTYTESAQIKVNVPNLTILGPNAGKAGNAIDRVEEAIILDTRFSISTDGLSGDGLVYDGVKFTGTSCIVAATANVNGLEIKNCVLAAKGRNLYSNSEVVYLWNYTLTNFNFEYNYFSGEAACVRPIRFEGKLKDSRFANNEFASDNNLYDMIRVDTVQGSFVFENNDVHAYTSAWFINVWKACGGAKFVIKDNKINGIDLSNYGGVQFTAATSDTSITILGNEFNSLSSPVIKVSASTNAPVVDIEYNKFESNANFCIIAAGTNVNYANNYSAVEITNDATATYSVTNEKDYTTVEELDAAYAIFNAEYNRTATVTFDSDGGNAVDPITFKDPTTVVLPTPVKEGYEFDGWYNGDVKVTALTEKVDVALKAKWLKIYTITFDSDGGTPVESISFADYTKVVLPQATKEGSAFDAWYDGDTKVTALTENKDYNLKAHYVTNRTVTFDVDGGTPVENIVYVDFATVVLPATSKEGFYFDGWYDGDTKVTALTESKDYNLKAKWLQIYTITFDVDGGSAVENITFYKLDGIVLPTPTKADVMFAGWFDGDNKVTAITTLANVSLKAHWQTPFTITFDVADGEPIAAIKFIDYTTVVLPATAVREGYIFEGWKDGENAASITENKDYALTAQWRQRATLVVNPEAEEGSGQYKTIASAIEAANEGDIVSITAGVYTEDVTVNKANIIIVGPNKGKAGVDASRVAEAELQGAFVVSANGVTVDGLKFTNNAAVGIGANDFTIKNSYIATKVKTVTGSGRKAMIYNSISTQIVNINILNNYLFNAGAQSGYTNQAISFNNVKNMYVKNNYITNEATSIVTANTENMIFYTVAGDIQFVGNEFHEHCDFEVFRIAQYSSTANVLIKDNKLYGIAEGSAMNGAFAVYTLTANSSLVITGNELHTNATNAIRVKVNAACPMTVSYNKFYSGAYATYSSNETINPTFTCNYFEKGAAEDAFGAANSAVETPEAVDQAYNAQ